jgi:serine/threonine protein kinase
MLIDTEGRVKLCDLGLARPFGIPTTVTTSGVALGTPRYIAPEQARGLADIDHRADIYALGVLLYEMLTGDLPVGSFAPPSSRPGVDPRLDAVVSRALEPDPAQRWQDAGELGAQVAAIAADPAPAARPAGGDRRDRRIPGGKHDWPRGRRVPFENEDKWGGLVVHYGLVGWEDDDLVLEFRTRDCLELRHSEARELRIPSANLGAATYKQRWLGGGELRFTGSKLQSFGDFPEVRRGQIRLTVDRHGATDARRLCTFVQRRLGERDA